MESSTRESASSGRPVVDIGGQSLQRRASSPFRQAVTRLSRHPQFRAGVALTAVVGLLALLAPALPLKDPLVMYDGQALKAPSWDFLFGTDLHGRDLFSRVVWGGRNALSVGALAVLLGILMGVPTGLLAGYFGGVADSAINRVSDTVLAFPPIMIGIAVAAALGPGLVNVAAAVAIVSMPVFLRITRASVLSEKEREYVLAARALGASDLQVVFRHISRNAVIPVLIQATVAIAYAAILEASLSFLGLGTQPPHPSWGTMLNEARAYIDRAIWYALFPGAALSMLLLGLNFLADSVRDALDPTQNSMG